MFYKTMFKKTTFNENCLNWCEQGISSHLSAVWQKQVTDFFYINASSTERTLNLSTDLFTGQYSWFYSI